MTTKALRRMVQEFRVAATRSVVFREADVTAAAIELERIERAALALSIQHTKTIREEGMLNAADTLESIAKDAR